MKKTFLFKFLFLILIITGLPLYAALISPSSELKDYQRHHSIPEEIWNEAEPHFLPKDHPIKNRLDALFSKTRLLASYETLKQAGFRIHISKSELDVVFHPDLKGYIIKFYLDTHENLPYFNKLNLTDKYISEVRLWLLRIAGVARIKEILDKHHYHHLIKVPKKWIYPLPLTPESKDVFSKYFVLVEEDMNLVNDEENKRRYREEMTPELLKALYTVLKEGVLYDSVYINNNPFSTDGKIAFIDTEEYDRKPVPFEKLLPHLSTEMQVYWKKLMQH